MNDQNTLQINNSQNPSINSKIDLKKRKMKRLLFVLFTIILVISIITFSIIPPIVMNSMVNGHIYFKKTYSASEFGIESNDIKLTTSDGLKIAAYEVFQPSPKAVVIFLSGIQNPSVTAFFGHAAMLKKNGYASILCEMRAHGESDGNTICVGYKEYLDVRAVVDYIKANDRYNNVPIVVYGLSMGGAVAINAIGKIPEINGLISMSAFSSWEDVFCDNMANMGIPKIICIIEKPFVKIYTAFKYGLSNTNISPKNQIKKLGNRPALIYHSKEDSQILYSSFERITKNVSGKVKVETWVKNGDYHFPTENIEKPEEDVEYSKHIITFLDSNYAK